ncbi:hypothetical protein XANCAGTX0491_005482 [Xanthoria calcicola]
MGYPCASPARSFVYYKKQALRPCRLTIKPSSFRAYTSVAERKEAEADTADSRQKWSHPHGGRAERASEGPSVVGLGAQGIIVLAILYPWVTDRTIRDAKGNEIVTLDTFAYARCMVFLQGKKSLDEYARVQAAEQEVERERSKERREKEKKAEKRAVERRVERDEEGMMIQREDAGRIQITIPHSMVQKCITATSTKEWGDLQEDAKALVAAEREKQAAERLKERPTRTTVWYP